MKHSDWAGIRILLFDWWDAATTGPVFLFLQSLSISGFKIKTNLAAHSARWGQQSLSAQTMLHHQRV